MSETEARIDRVTHDPHSDEIVLYLIEEGPWPTDDDGWRQRLKEIQDRVLDAFNIAVDGHLAQRFPDARGRRVRIQIDSPSGSPNEVEALVDRLKDFFEEDNEFGRALEASPFVATLRVMTGHRLGRFHQSAP